MAYVANNLSPHRIAFKHQVPFHQQQYLNFTAQTSPRSPRRQSHTHSNHHQQQLYNQQQFQQVHRRQPHLHNSLEDEPADDDLDSLADRLDGAMPLDVSPLRDLDLLSASRRSIMVAPPSTVQVRRCQSMRYTNRAPAAHSSHVTPNSVKVTARRVGDPMTNDWHLSSSSSASNSSATSNNGLASGSSSSGSSPANNQSTAPVVKERRGSSTSGALSTNVGNSGGSSGGNTLLTYNSRSSFRRFGTSASNSVYRRRGSQLDTTLNSVVSNGSSSANGSSGNLTGSSSQLNQYATFNRSNTRQPLSRIRINVIDNIPRFKPGKCSFEKVSLYILQLLVCRPNRFVST
jgi:hypothetical protein